MSAEVKAQVSKLPTGVSGALAGFVTGWLVDKIVAHIYITYVPAEQRPVTPLWAFDDWILILVSIAVMFKKRDFGAGMFLGVVLGSRGII